jgi:hypothetical protein
MDESIFDPERILTGTVSGRMATRRPGIPPGEWVAEVEAIEPKLIPQKRDDGAEEMIPAIIVTFAVTDEPEVAEVTKQEISRITCKIKLQLDDDTGELLLEDNPRLGQLREAVGQNDDEDWSIANLLNSRCKLIVEEWIPDDDSGRKIATIKYFNSMEDDD